MSICNISSKHLYSALLLTIFLDITITFWLEKLVGNWLRMSQLMLLQDDKWKLHETIKYFGGKETSTTYVSIYCLQIWNLKHCKTRHFEVIANIYNANINYFSWLKAIIKAVQLIVLMIHATSKKSWTSA